MNRKVSSQEIGELVIAAVRLKEAGLISSQALKDTRLRVFELCTKSEEFIDAAVSDQLRQAIRDSDINQTQIAKKIDMQDADLSRFMNKKSGIRMKHVDKLCEFLGLRLHRSTIASDPQE